MFCIIKLILLNEEYVDRLARLEAECFSDPWTENMFMGDLKSEHTCYFGAFDNYRLVGYAGMWMSVDDGQICNVAVHPEYRRKGIASSLVEKLIGVCIERNLLGITLEVRESNNKAVLLYKKLGFEKVGLRKNYYKNPTESAILMTKTFLKEGDD